MLLLSTEASLFVCGSVRSLPEGQSAPGNQEIIVDYYEVIGHSPPGGADSLLNEVEYFIERNSCINYFLFTIRRNHIQMFN